MGHTGAAAQDLAVGQVFQQFRAQAMIMAYSDVFYYCALIAFLVIPFCFLLSPGKAAGSGATH